MNLLANRSVLCAWRATCLRARVSSRAPVCLLFVFDRQIWADHNLEQSSEPIFNNLKERLCDENSTLPRNSSLETAASEIDQTSAFL